jgi:hypothetical protein
MQDDQNTPPPPLPPLGMTPPPPPMARPPIRVSPLEYGRPDGAGKGATNTLYHQAAKAAWVAPVVALALGCVSSTMRGANSNHTMAIVIGAVNGLLIIAGFVMAIVAFFGVKRYGAAGIVAPAIVGLIINLIFIGAAGALFFYGQRAVTARTTAARAVAARPMIPFSSPQSSLRQTGWFGAALQPGNVTITLVSMKDGHADTSALRSALKNDASLMIIAIDNRNGATPAILDTRNAQLVFADGRNVTSLDPATVAQPAEVAGLSPPFRVEPGGLVEGKILFIPPDLDLAKLQLIRLTLSGAQIEVPGRIFTADEKTRLVQGGQAKQQQPPP